MQTEDWPTSAIESQVLKESKNTGYIYMYTIFK